MEDRTAAQFYDEIGEELGAVSGARISMVEQACGARAPRRQRGAERIGTWVQSPHREEPCTPQPRTINRTVRSPLGTVSSLGAQRASSWKVLRRGRPARLRTGRFRAYYSFYPPRAFAAEDYVGARAMRQSRPEQCIEAFGARDVPESSHVTSLQNSLESQAPRRADSATLFVRAAHDRCVTPRVAAGSRSAPISRTSCGPTSRSRERGSRRAAMAKN